MTHKSDSFDRIHDAYGEICTLFVEYEAEDFASLWMLQNIFRDITPPHTLTEANLKDIKCVKRKPVVCFKSDQNIVNEIDKFKLRVGNGKCKNISDETLSHLSGLKNRPSTVVICLNPDGVHGNCRLSDEDITVLKQTKNLLEGKHNIVYLIQGKRHHKSYDTKDLKRLSTAVSQIKGEEDNAKLIFRKMFFIEEDQALFRIGICLLESVIPYLMRICDGCAELLESFYEECRIAADSAGHYDNVTTKMKDVNQNYSVTEKRCKSYLHSSKPSSKRKVRTATSEISYSERNIGYPNKRNKGRKSQNDKTGALSSHQDKQTATRVRMSDKTSKHVPKTQEKSFLQAESSHDYLIKNILDTVGKEVNTIRESILFHEFKTVALRHEKVKGFGCTDNSLNVNLKFDLELDEKEVREYLAYYFDYKDGMINGKYKICIQFRERKIKYFSNLEQGSKIQKYGDPTEEKNKKFGSVGMFLHDDNGSYYFTTCAHVIGKGAPAFNPVDNTQIGVNIFAINSGEDTSSPFFDFSIVKIIPERALTCTFGLKAITGEFTNFRVFRGDILEVRNRQMYIWGASDLNMRSGKCTSCEDNNGFISFCVNTEHFARPGDSGSIICIGDQVKSCYAAFILVGNCSDRKPEEYVAYKVSNAIDVIQSKTLSIKPYLLPEFNVQITTKADISDEQRPLKRKPKDSSKKDTFKKLFCSR